jgi:amino acid permease
MKVVIIVLVVVLAVIFVGGSLTIGGDSIFGHIDSALGTNVLTGLYSTLFFFLYRGTETVEEGVAETGEDLREFEQRPIGIDNKRKYKQLNDAAQY